MPTKLADASLRILKDAETCDCISRTALLIGGTFDRGSTLNNSQKVLKSIGKPKNSFLLWFASWPRLCRGHFCGIRRGQRVEVPRAW